MTERERAVFRRLGDFLALRLLGLRNLRQRDHDECECENGQCAVHQREYVADLRILDTLRNQQAGQDDDRRAAERVERAARLNELIAFVSASAELVEHRVHDGVEQTHGETCDEGAEQIDTEALDRAGERLDADAGKADGDSDQCGFLVAVLLQHVAGRIPHDRISDEVREHAQRSHPVGHIELVLQNVTHR